MHCLLQILSLNLHICYVNISFSGHRCLSLLWMLWWYVSDGVYRGEKLVNLKQIADEALEKCLERSVSTRSSLFAYFRQQQQDLTRARWVTLCAQFQCTHKHNHTCMSTHKHTHKHTHTYGAVDLISEHQLSQDACSPNHIYPARNCWLWTVRPWYFLIHTT